MDSRTPKQKSAGVHCTNIFKDPVTISSSLNKRWAEVITILEDTGKADYNEDMQRHAYPNSNEFEVSGK